MTVSPLTSLPLASLKPFQVLAKPTGAICNLDCKYCFFLSKEALYPGSDFRMPNDLLEIYIRQLLEPQTGPVVTIAWQGGEPTLMGLEFFRRSVELVEKYRKPDQRVEHSIQTNGTRIDEEWCNFFKQHEFLVGLSMDGTREMHDTYRVDKGGKGTFDQVLRAWNLMRDYQVRVNILCTVHAANVEHPTELYKFFRDELQAEFIQLIPIVERTDANLLPLANLGWKSEESNSSPLYLQTGDKTTSRSVRPNQFGRFLIEIFEEWVRHDVGRVFVQMFDTALGAHLGQYALCIFAPTCGSALALEHNGDLYSCDHFVEPEFKLGNIRQDTMADLANSEKQRAFGSNKNSSLPQYCRECDVRFACNGGCPKDRFSITPDGEAGLNYLCAGYKAFFQHIAKPMQRMADSLQSRRSPAAIMDWYATSDIEWRASAAKMGRNDRCPCGSGRKVKQCHAA